MNLTKFFNSEFNEHTNVLNESKHALLEPFKELVKASVESISNGGKILFFGNGGSAADSQHLAAELVIRYKKNRAPISAIALTTDSSAITAGGNDIGFDQIFARQVSALAKPGDIAIGISTSGNSENVIQGLLEAKSCGTIPAGLSGNKGGRMKTIANPHLIVPSSTTARIQEMHIILGHLLCDALEQELNLL